MVCYLGLGSNLGNREENILKAKSALDVYLQINVLQVSTIIETEPIGNTNQPKFLNCVLKIETYLEPAELLTKCLETEFKLGRIRTKKWGPRIIDIDILFYGDQIINEDYLVIPHPELHKREFVLRSLVEICPEFVHPKMNNTILQIYEDIQ